MGNKKLFWLSLILLGLLYQVQAQAGSCGKYVNWTFSGGTLTVSGMGDMENYVNGDATPWEHLRNDIKTAVIEEGVTSIGGSAFYDCTELTSVSIPQSVTRFEAYAFTWCHNLTSITIPENVTRIGKHAFTECFKLTSITSLNRTPPTLDGNVFMYTDLSKIVLCVPIETKRAYFVVDENYAGQRWRDFGYILEIHPTQGSCGKHVNWTFSGGTLTVSGSGDMADYVNADATPWEHLKYNIKTAVIEEGVTSIGSSAFYDCTGLTSVSIPQSVRRFESYAFTWCHNLTSITIPENVTRIGAHAFRECIKLTSITSLNHTPPALDGNVFLDTDLSKITLHVPSGSKQAYNEGQKWMNFRNVKEITTWGEDNPFIWALSSSGVLTIRGTGEMPAYRDREGNGSPWHSDRRSVKTVIFEGRITSIMDNAFYECEKMTSVTIPRSVINIGKNAFYGCKGLRSITIPQKVTSIGESAFTGCSGLTYITNLNVNPPSVFTNVFANVPTDVTLYVPAGSAETYENTPVWKQFGEIIVNDAALSSLSVSQGILSPQFHPDKVFYTLPLTSSVSSFDITTTANHPNARIEEVWTYSIYDGFLGFEGVAFCVIKVTSEGGVSKDYSVRVIKPAPKNDAYLRSLVPTVGTLEPEFSPYTTNYTVRVEDAESSIKFTAMTNHQEARGVTNNGVEYPLNGDVTLSIPFTVTAEDGFTTKTYKVEVRRISDDVTLKSLSVIAGMREFTLTPQFRPENRYYSVNVENTVSNVIVKAETNHPRARVSSGNGEYSLKKGTTNISIMVTAENSQFSREYTVTINRSGGTGIPSVGAAAVPVYFNKQILHVDSPVAETVHIYSVAGTLLHRLEKPAGKISFAINSPKQVVIVKGSSGWAGKLIINY